MPWLVGVDDWIASYEHRQRKIELDPNPTEKRFRQFFAVYGCNGTEFSYVMLQNNGILQRQNGETATEKRQRNGRHRALLVLC